MALKWLRKNNKKLLAILGVPIIILFLLPSFMNNGPSQQDQDYGWFINADNQRQVITMNDLVHRDNMLQAMVSLGLADVSRRQLINQVPELDAIMGGVSPLSSVATHLLLFGDTGYARGARGYLYEFAKEWATDKQDMLQLERNIDTLTASATGHARLYYLLLSQEAHRNGIYATDEQIDMFLSVCRRATGVETQSVLNRYNISNNELRAAVGDYLAILRYGNVLIRSLVVSEPQVKSKVDDLVGMTNVSGRYVQFDSKLFNEKMAAPTDEQLQQLLDKYKDVFPADVKKDSEDNPHHLGYMLPDRLQVEYLKVDISSNAQKLVSAEFDKMPVDKQEELLRKCWADNKEMFKAAVKKPEPKEGADPQNNEPDSRYQEFDEVIGQIKQIWVQEQATERAQQLLVQARGLSKTATVTGNSPVHSDYAAIAAQLTTEALPVEYGKSLFLSMKEAQSFQNFGSVRKMQDDQKGPGLLSILFACNPLRDKPTDSIDQTPLELHEDVTSLLSLNYNDHATAAFMVRIIDTDKERQPVSLDDDGRQGLASTPPISDNKSLTRKQLEQDYKAIQAYELARKQAQAFAQDARDNWHGGLNKLNGAFRKDPNDPNTFEDKTLDDARARRDNAWAQAQRIAGMIQNSPNPPPFMKANMEQNQQLVTTYSQLLVDTMKFARKNAADKEPGNKDLPILERPAEMNCLVFENLQVTAPTPSEYAKRKAITAEKLVFDTQGPLVLAHFNPKNIEKRSGFEEIKMEDEQKTQEIDENTTENVE